MRINPWWVALIILAVLAAAWIANRVGQIVQDRSFVTRAARIAAVPRPAPRIDLILGDITEQEVDAIVNAAKPSLLGGGGVDGAIHRVGGSTILRECRQLRATTYPDGLPTGDAVATTAGLLPADWVIHTVGPVFNVNADGQSKLLRDCYTNSLAIADQLGAETVAFPLISSGVYGWPLGSAITEALDALRNADTSVQEVRLVVFDEATYRLARDIAWEVN